MRSFFTFSWATSPLSKINYDRLWMAACFVSGGLFLICLMMKNGVLEHPNGEEPFVRWAFAGMMVLLAFTAMIAKSPFKVISSYLVYIAAAFAAEGNYAIPSEVKYWVLSIFAIAALIAAYWHLDGDTDAGIIGGTPRSSDDIDALESDGSSDYGQRVAGISRSPQG